MLNPQPVTYANPQVGPQSSTINCPACQRQIRTAIRHEPTNKTHIMAVIICLLCCWPCAWMPYCIDSCQDTNHYCPGCKSFIGTYKH